MSKKFESEQTKRIQEQLDECQSNLRQIETEKMYWKNKCDVLERQNRVKSTRRKSSVEKMWP
ncbi:hypothetical protein DERF_014568 [Dermatophagoides farinae]|uniref:Uncharacterized protein n=1 Tax=Dermatophagoides farinae TaxID=6954 RepID=A0A922HJ47_DERFA|nr:hypothetical protein DERF_014551 [Dermatophagoides farinae]KAH9493839.1 hypothetical protein DERF_014568 [Dermatophagoides farinae]